MQLEMNLKHYTGKPKVKSLIADAISREIVPDLLRKKIDTQLPNIESFKNSGFNAQQVDKFCGLLSYGDRRQVLKHFEMYLAEGVSVTHLFLGLVSQSARRLGNMWELDDCSFGDVTIGLTALHDVVREYTSRLSHELDVEDFKGSIFISPMPGETHVFGAFMLEAFFIAAGWNVKSSISQTREDFLQEFATHEYSAIGISVTQQQDEEVCASLINNIRNMSLNRDVKVLVGGKPFIDNKDLFKQVGADATARNGLEALEVVQSICNEALQYS